MLCVLNLPSEGGKGQKKTTPPLLPFSLKQLHHHPLSKQKQRRALTVYALESVFEPRYRSENADAARQNYQSERLRRARHDGKCASKSYTIYLKICDGRDGGATFQLGELLGAQEHRGQVSPVRLERGGEMQ